MEKVVLVCLLAWVAVTISPGIHTDSHKSVTSQCCLAKGGKVCGTLMKDCCKSQCESGLLNSKWCKNNQQFEPICETCTSICKKQGGIPCQVSVDSGRVSCCSVDNCQRPKNTTASGLGDKILSFATAKIIGMAANQQHQMADQLIEKFMGPGGFCKQGTEIGLGECVADSFLELVETKVMG